MSIIIAKTNKRLSANSGLLLLQSLTERSLLQDTIAPAIPEQTTGVQRNLNKFKNLILGFVAGAECLDDMNHIQRDPAFTALTDDTTYHPKTYADFLRSFNGENLYHLQGFLMETAIKLRLSQPAIAKENLIFDCDSTLIPIT